jgi:DNA-binding NarL/FixJ family response regulator
MIRIMIADDQTLFRNMLEEVLNREPLFEIVGTASDGKEAVELAKRLRPDIVLMDIKMPEKSGIHALQEISNSVSTLKVIMLTTFEDIQSITDSCLIGAKGYLVKDIKPEVLIMAIKCVYHDIVTFHKSAYETICSQQVMSHNTSRERYTYGNFVFDGVDIRIMRCITEGMTNREIGILLNYSEGTIKNRVSKILSVTGLTDRTQISVFALKNNIV